MIVRFSVEEGPFVHLRWILHTVDAQRPLREVRLRSAQRPGDGTAASGLELSSGTPNRNICGGTRVARLI